jgi:hypothetical protein
VNNLFRFRWLLLSGLLAELLIVAWSAYQSDTSITLFQWAARYSGRLSLVYFLIILGYCSLHPTFKTREITTTKFSLVLYLAILHIIHFGLLATYLYLSNNAPNPLRLIGGILAYLLIVTYPLVLYRQLRSNKQSSILLQMGYLYYVWVVILVTYITRLKGDFAGVEGDSLIHKVLIIVVVVALVGHLIISYIKPLRQQLRLS